MKRLVGGVARRRRRTALLVGVGVPLAAAMLLVLPLRSAVFDPDVLAEYAATGLFILGAVAPSVAVAVGIVLRGQDARQAAALAAARRGERAEVARELHDVVAHHVTGIVVATQAARSVGAAGSPPAVDGALAAVEDSGVQVLAAMRRVVGVLRADDAPPPR